MLKVRRVVYLCTRFDVEVFTMTRKEEILLAFVSGVLLAFGIHESAKDKRRAASFQASMEQDSKEIAKYWEQVGSFIREVQSREQKASA